MKESDFEQLWRTVIAQFQEPDRSIHGPAHWRRVERNGLLLAGNSGADPIVVRLFALFHDSRRENDGYDKGHGARGADYAASLRGTVLHLSDDRFDQLHYACTWHTDKHHHADPTIATCWDADRLDLPRVGIRPRPEYMNTALARRIARKGNVELFLAEASQDLTNQSQRR